MFMLFGTSATNMSWRTPQMSLTGAPLSDYHTPFDDGMAGPLDEQFEMDGEANPAQKVHFCLQKPKNTVPGQEQLMFPLQDLPSVTLGGSAYHRRPYK